MIVYNVYYVNKELDDPVFILTCDTHELADKFVHGMMNISDDYKRIAELLSTEARKLCNREVLGNDPVRTAIIYQAHIEIRNREDPLANKAWFEHIVSVTRAAMIPDNSFRFSSAFSWICVYLGLTEVDVPLLIHAGDKYEITPVEVTTRLPEYLWGVVE